MLDAICQEFCEWFHHFNGTTHVVLETQYFMELFNRLLSLGYVCEVVTHICEHSEFCAATFTEATSSI
ncbi:MAG: hypothetical protein CMI31_13335 [Opitutae bacterium]|nr:hypothetical protein [Opitutae bacterium]